MKHQLVALLVDTRCFDVIDERVHGVKQILRTHHEAAVNMALLTHQTAPALALLQGLAERVDEDDLVPLVTCRRARGSTPGGTRATRSSTRRDHVPRVLR